MYINGKEVRTGKTSAVRPPHDHQHVVREFSYVGGKEHVEQAIGAALAARQAWSDLPGEQRAAIFLKAADLLAGPTARSSTPRP